MLTVIWVLAVCLLCKCLHTEHVFSCTSTTVCHPSCSQQILIFWKWSLVLWCEQMFLMDNFSLDQKHSGLRTLLIWRGLLRARTSNSLQADVDLLNIIIIIILTILVSDINFISWYNSQDTILDLRRRKIERFIFA